LSRWIGGRRVIQGLLLNYAKMICLYVLNPPPLSIQLPFLRKFTPSPPSDGRHTPNDKDEKLLIKYQFICRSVCESKYKYSGGEEGG